MRPIGFDFEFQYNITKMFRLLSHNAVVNGVGEWGNGVMIAYWADVHTWFTSILYSNLYKI